MSEGRRLCEGGKGRKEEGIGVEERNRSAGSRRVINLAGRQLGMMIKVLVGIEG